MAEVGAPISLDGAVSIRVVDASAYVIFILHQKMQKMAKCSFWYWLTWVVPDTVQRAIKWLCVCARVCVCVCVCAYAAGIASHSADQPVTSTRCPWKLQAKTGGRLHVREAPLKMMGKAAHTATAVFQDHRTAWWQFARLC